MQQVTNTPLWVASFGRMNLARIPDAKSGVTLEWTALQSGSIRLRASGIKPKLYYRMDSVRPEGAHSYQWPTDVLSALQLEKDDIGIVAWTERKVGSVVRNVYVPVRAGAPSSGQAGAYDLVVVPGDEFAEISVSLNSVAADGTPGKQIINARPLGYGYYPAGRSVKIRVDPLPAPGIYLLQLTAMLRNGGVVTHEVWFIN